MNHYLSAQLVLDLPKPPFGCISVVPCDCQKTVA
jgi:hypothetical protein